jgi:hypothetical protein
MKMLKVVAASSNAKLGPGVASTYRPVGPTCPAACPLATACYAKRGRVQIYARRAEADSDALRAAAGNTLIRHMVSGDWFRPAADGRKIVDRPLLREAIALHEAAPWLTGWSYTHGPDAVARAGFGPGSWPTNFQILASTHTDEDHVRLNEAGWVTARVIEEPGDRLPDEFLCPVDTQKRLGVPASNRTTCARCRACFDGRGRNIAFLKF